MGVGPMGVGPMGAARGHGSRRASLRFGLLKNLTGL